MPSPPFRVRFSFVNCDLIAIRHPQRLSFVNCDLIAIRHPRRISFVNCDLIAIRHPRRLSFVNCDLIAIRHPRRISFAAGLPLPSLIRSSLPCPISASQATRRCLRSKGTRSSRGASPQPCTVPTACCCRCSCSSPHLATSPSDSSRAGRITIGCCAVDCHRLPPIAASTVGRLAHSPAHLNRRHEVLPIAIR